MSLANVNLRTLLIGTIGTLSLLVVTVSLIMAFNARKDGWVAQRVVKVSRVADALLQSSGEIITERDLASEFVITGSSSTAGVFVAVSGRMDASWLKAKKLLSAERRRQGTSALSNGAEQLVKEAEAAYGAFAQVRSAMMIELKKPIGDRDSGVLTSWHDTAAKAIDALASLRRVVARQASSVDPVAQTHSLLKDLTVSITDFAGRESTIVAGAMFSGSPLSPREGRLLLDYRGRMAQAWLTISNTADAAAVDPEVKAAVESVRNQFIGKFGKSRQANFDAGISASDYPFSAKQWLNLTREAVTSLTGLRDALIKANQIHAAGEAAKASRALVVLALFLMLGLAATVASFMIITRRVIKPIVELTGTTGVLAGGNMEAQVPGRDRQDEIGAMARSLEQIRALGVDAVRSQAAVNDASSCILMTDMDGMVIFANRAMRRLHGQLADDLSALPGFSVDRIVGQRFSDLHDIAALGAANLANLDRQVDVRMLNGGRTIDLKVGPVLNEQDERLGTVVEWNDRSHEVAVENEVSGIVAAATQGDFSKRLDEEGKAGFMLELTKGVNELVDTVDNGLTETVGVMAGLASGDLTKRMTGDYQGNFQKLKDDVNRTSDRLREIAGQIVTVSGSVDGATGEIGLGVTDLSERTEHQASSLEETTASMEELSATVKQNADNAQEANQVAVAARLSAANGGEVVDEVVQAMSRIEGSSKKITDIVGLIQEIAFQTNLLALNAAVEAARAGDAGKGFAVVANEVRALAQRSAQASKDIKELIASSDSEVRDGVELVNRAGASLDEILNSVKKVADFVSEIAAASQEQSSGIDQVSRAINSMEEMTQQNGALVEETTAALQSAQTQVGDLREVVAFFKTGEDAMMMTKVELEPEDAQIDHPVRQQQSRIRTAVSAGSAVAHAIDDDDADWQEF